MLRHLINHLHDLWNRFIEAQDRPHAMAGGVAIGIFFGFIPVIGLKTLLALGVALITGCNPIAAVVGVTFHDLFIWFWPVLFRMEFQLGHWLLSHPHEFAPKLERADFRLSEIMQWDNVKDVIYPTLVGAVVIAIPVTIVAYGVTLLLMHYREQKKLLG